MYLYNIGDAIQQPFVNYILSHVIYFCACDYSKSADNDGDNDCDDDDNIDDDDGNNEEFSF